MKVAHQKPSTATPWPWIGLAAAVALVAAWYWARGSALPSDPDVLWKQAETDFLKARYDQAETALEQLARRRKPTPLDLMLRAQLDMVRNRPAQVLADLAAVPDDHFMAPQARLLAGQFELRRQRLRAAESLLRKAIELDPTQVQPHRELIYIYGMLLRRPELRAEFRALSELAPLTYDNVFHWCLTRNSVWEPKEITADLRGYLEADKDDRWARLALADNLRQLSRPTEAEAILEPLAKDDPEAIVIRARLALDRNDDRALEAVLRNGPEDHAELARLRGRLALSRRDVAAALKHFRAAYQAEPDHRDAIAGLGQALALSGDAAGAAPYLALAREHDNFATLMQRASTPAGRKDPSLWRALGDACEKIHRLPEARAWYGLILQKDPIDPVAQKALHRLNAQLRAGAAAKAPAAGPAS